MLEVRLIGRFDVHCDGKPVTISSRIGQSLLAYLILSAGNQHRREKLAGMFWPDVAEKKARAHLRYELWLIRKALSVTSKVDYLITDNISIAFNSAADYWLDVAQLKSVGKTASVDDLMHALSVFQGELLPGFYEDWVTEEREHLHALYNERITRLLEMLEKEHRWKDILEWAERWISFDPASEAAYRALMVAYDALGDRAKVATTYERCVQALRELDLEPSEETRALAVKQTAKLNIPLPLTSYIGREKELREVAQLLSKSRLVTLTGSGGVGKTRLSIQVVADVLDSFPDGVWFLDLAPVTDPTLVPTALANLLKLRESAELTVNDLLINYFRTRCGLIIFDNCEHLIDACAQLIHLLLTSCEHLSVLATSREALHVSGESPYRVPSLEILGSEMEPGMEILAKIESVQLFIQRASAISPGLRMDAQNLLVIAQICQRLDGIPLAIELAAARTNMLSVQQILARLDDRFNLLTRGLRTSLPRHQTLRETIEWSYNLLSEKEQLLFRRLAVFAGGWMLEAVEEVCGGNPIQSSEVLDLLSQLVEKSLVSVKIADTERGSPSAELLRYHMLETIRQFAHEKLGKSREEEQIRAMHLQYFHTLAQEAEPELYGARQIEWMQKLEDEHENVRAALSWSLQRDATTGQQLAAALWWSWNLNGHLSEGYEWLKKLLAISSHHEMPIRAKLLSGQAELANELGYAEAAKKLAEESIALFRKLGDELSIAFPLSTLANNPDLQSNYEQITRLAMESLDLFKRAGNQWGASRALRILGYNASWHGDFEQARKFYEESLLICKEIGDQEGMAFTLYTIASLPVVQQNMTRALELYEEALKLARIVNSKPTMVNILTEMGQALSYNGDYERGRMLLQESLEVNREMGSQAGVARSLRYLGWTARLQGDYSMARRFYSESLQLAYRIQYMQSITASLIHIGNLMLVQGSAEKFVFMLASAESATPDSLNSLLPCFGIETEKFIATAHATLGDEVYAAAWQKGQQMSLDEAVSFALNELQ